MTQLIEQPGPLLREIRQAHNLGRNGPELTTEDMAGICHVGLRMIQAVEKGDRQLGHPAENLYINAFGFEPPDVARLKNMCTSYRRRNDVADELDYYDFAVTTQHPALRQAAKKMLGLNHPAFLVDPLSYNHIVNSYLNELFGVGDRQLRNPYLWHSVGTKFFPTSPVRETHVTPRNAYYSLALRGFHTTLADYFFAPQSLLLQKSLLELSPEDYAQHWRSAVLMVQPPWDEETLRVLSHRGRKSQWGIKQLEVITAPQYEAPRLSSGLSSLRRWMTRPVP